tara:strand:- start:12433 stop:13941 length:1509 start_codon:yes stop_codon:yes gene_type:complete
MPTEENEIANADFTTDSFLLPSSSNNNEESLDVTEFNVAEIPEGHVEVLIEVDDEDRTIVVGKDYAFEDNEHGWMVDNASDMAYFINNHGVCFMHNCEWKKVEDECEVVYSDYSNEWLWNDDAMYGYYNRGEEGYFHHDEDYVRCSDTDDVYVNSEEADYHHCYYCEGCDEYRDSDNHDFDDCQNRGNGDHFNNIQANDVSYMRKDRQLSHHKMYGTDSPTFTKSNGMQYTFGVEMETQSGYIESSVWNKLNLSSVYDGSISGNEYVTGVLKGDYGFNHLKKITDNLSQDHHIDTSCGVHVHIGGVFNRRFTIMLLRLCYHLQDDIYRMMPQSRITNSYCKPIPTWASEVNFQNYKNILYKYIYGGSEDSKDVLDKFHNKKNSHDRYAGTRYRWVNINNFSTKSGKPTVEFRVHGASLNYEKLRNWVLICMSIVRFAENRQKMIWSDLNNILLDTVIKDSLGNNLGEQVMQYYNKRRSKFESTTGQSSQLPSARLERNGVIQ